MHIDADHRFFSFYVFIFFILLITFSVLFNQMLVM